MREVMISEPIHKKWKIEKVVYVSGRVTYILYKNKFTPTIDMNDIWEEKYFSEHLDDIYFYIDEVTERTREVVEEFD